MTVCEGRRKALSEDIITLLNQNLPQGRFTTREVDFAPMLTDWRGRFHGKAIGLVTPFSTAEVQQVVNACIKTRTPLVVQGGNTGMVGAATPDDSGKSLLISLRGMSRVLDINSLSNTITLEAGCSLVQAQEAASRIGTDYPLSLTPAAQCQIGGTIATNAGGLNVIRFGMMRENVLGLEVVTGDGNILPLLRELRKDNSGYDLKQIFIGSEGTLGIITKATVRLFPKMRFTATFFAGVPSIAAGLDLLQRLQHIFPQNITAFEIISKTNMEICLRFDESLRPPLKPTHSFAILCEIGTAHELNHSQLKETVSISSSDIAIARTKDEADRFWRLRKFIPEAEKRFAPAIKQDISLPLDRIESFLQTNPPKIKREFEDAIILVMGHLGDGNLHYNIAFENRSPQQVQDIEAKINDIIFEDVVAMQGSIAAEHGVGLLRKQSLLKFKDPTALEAMRAIKNSFDPHGILNPGKVFI